MTSRSRNDRTDAALAAIPDQESLVGVFVSQTGVLATVVVGTSVVAVKVASQYPVAPGVTVRLERRDGQLIMLGPAVPLAATGKVTATGSPTCTVEYPSGSGVTAQMGYNTAYTPTIGDDVLISWDAQGGTVVGKVSTVPGTVTPPTPPPPAPTKRRQTFTAIDSASYQSRWWTPDVYASDGNIGAWWYGRKIRDTIPDSATITFAAIYLPLKQTYGDSPVIGVHTSETRPGGAVSFYTTSPIEPRSGWVQIPNSYVDYLKANPGGIGWNHGGYSIWAGVGSDGLSGALDIAYTT